MLGAAGVVGLTGMGLLTGVSLFFKARQAKQAAAEATPVVQPSLTEPSPAETGQPPDSEETAKDRDLMLV